jgi:hypothetical protein
MKIRTDFITNSSSSAFVILTKENLNKSQIKDELIKVLKIPSDFILPKLGEDIAQVLSSSIDEELDIHEYMENVASVEKISELKKTGTMGKTVYENYREYPYIMLGFVTNESDEPVEVLLTDESLYFKNEKIVIAKDEGY